MADQNLYLHLCVCTITLASFILLALTTFSAPLSDKLYFLRSSQDQGVRFGTWGWCLEGKDVCMTPMKLGYTWDPQIDIPITGFLALYPIAMILTFPLRRLPRPNPTALIFMVVTFDTARKRFTNAGFSAEFGPLLWISLAASILLALPAVLSFMILPQDENVSSSESLSGKEAYLTPPPYRRRLRPISCVPRP
ncbi:hypothetical protein FA13DRAFT_1788951 [Coprinellus micaceus]|uniref:Uncharacterized protein n=1 Tax=Coprinellus micaceus TaxID=71717 RepID=A0A4Y7TLY3_COPMI|nr:hypothetical protein FA13DRAFT_1788951 [Coprinellus micaceus]